MKVGVMKSIVLLAAMALCTTNVFAGTRGARNQGGLFAIDSHHGYILLARGGNGGGGNGAGGNGAGGNGAGGNGAGGNGAGDGTGNGGHGPEDGTGNGPGTGDCTNT